MIEQNDPKTSGAVILEGAVVRGDVEIGEGSSVWFNAVIRAEGEAVRIGRNTNIQDGAVLHVDDGMPLTIGDGVTIGHGAIVLSGARIGQNCIVGAGALVTGKTVVPDGWMAFGNPAKPVRRLKAAEIEDNLHSAALYVELKERYRK